MVQIKRQHLLLFGPLSTLIACLGIFLDSLYWHPGAGQTLSDVSLSSWPAPIIFALSLSLIGITVAVFSVALNEYWPPAFQASVFGGICLAMAGWIQYLLKGRLSSFMHGLCIVLVVAVYELIIWQLARRGPDQIKIFSRAMFYIIFISAILTAVAINLIHGYIIFFELASFILLQIWIVGSAYLLGKI